MNVILLVVDTLRADHLGCYGNPWIRTPNLDRLASDSVVLERAYPEGCPTLQARRAIWTGRRTFPFTDNRNVPGDRLNVQLGWQPLHDSDWCVQEILRDEGYRTGLVTDCPQFFKPGMNFHRGFDTWDFIRCQAEANYHSAYALEGAREACSSFDERRRQAGGRQHRAQALQRFYEEEYCAPLVFRHAIRWLEENHGLERFFLVVDSFDPHEPWDPPAYYRTLYSRDDLLSGPYSFESGNMLGKTEQDVLAARAGYAGEVTMYDRWLGHFMDTAERMGLLEDTLIVFVSDHGTSLGEHSKLHKGPPGLYEGTMHIPMMVRHPKGVGAGQRIEALVYNMDLTPTILAACGQPVPDEMQGLDLWPLIQGEVSSIRNCVTSGYNHWIWFRDESWTFSGDLARTDERLFGIEDDPAEEQNLAPDRPDVVEQIRGSIVEEAGELHPDPGPFWPPPPDYKEKWHGIR